MFFGSNKYVNFYYVIYDALDMSFMNNCHSLQFGTSGISPLDFANHESCAINEGAFLIHYLIPLLSLSALEKLFRQMTLSFLHRSFPVAFALLAA